MSDKKPPPVFMPPERGTKAERLARERVRKNLYMMWEDNDFDWYVKELVPDAWATLEQDVEVTEPKEKITLRLDRSVAQFYRALGRGYQGRINHILATYAQLKIAKVTRMDARMRREFPELRQYHKTWEEDDEEA